LNCTTIYKIKRVKPVHFRYMGFFIALYNFLLCYLHKVLVMYTAKSTLKNNKTSPLEISTDCREVYEGDTFRKSMNYYSFREKEAKNIAIDFVGKSRIQNI